MLEKDFFDVAVAMILENGMVASKELIERVQLMKPHPLI